MVFAQVICTKNGSEIHGTALIGVLQMANVSRENLV